MDKIITNKIEYIAILAQDCSKAQNSKHLGAYLESTLDYGKALDWFKKGYYYITDHDGYGFNVKVNIMMKTTNITKELLLER